MPALISWVCRTDHDVQERGEYLSMVTVHQRSWAYCVRGGANRHRWEVIEPTPVELLHPSRRPLKAVAEEPASRRAG